MRGATLVIALLVSATAPEKAFAQTTTAPDGWVVLTVEEYRALRERAEPTPPPPAGPPVGATLTRIDYDLRIEGESAVGRALVTVDVLRDGWTQVQLPTGLLVRDARIDGRPVPLVEGPPPYVLLPASGRVVLALDIALRLVSSAGTESIALPASASPISRATLTLPRSGIDLSALGGLITDRVESATESRWIAHGRPNEPLRLSWKRKVDDRRSAQPLRTRAHLTSVIGLGEEVSQLAAAVRVEVLQGIAREVTLALPSGLVVNHVNGANVGDWDAAVGVLRVQLLDPVATETSFLVQGEIRTPREGPVPVPLVRMPSAERENGGVAVDVGGSGEIAERQARGMDPADISELGEIVAGRESPSMIAFRLRPMAGSEPRSLNVTVVRYTPQAVLIANIEEARYRTLVTDEGRLLVEARYAIRNNQRSFLQVKVPPRSTVWSAAVSGRPIRPGVAGGDAILLPLEKGRAGEDAPAFVVQLVYLQEIDRWTGKGEARVDLPTLDLPISRTGLQLYYSPKYRVGLQPGTFRTEADPGPFTEVLRDAAPAARPMDSKQEAASKLQALVDRFRSEGNARTVTGALPVSVVFPAFGPSLFLASELTAETTAPSVPFAYRRR